MATYPVELAPGASKEGKVCVAVGGGGGFIGSWLALDLKKKGFYVICADWKRNEFMEVPEFCDEFHLADLRIPTNCLRVCDGCRDVYNLAADMGGMGFIKSNESVLMYNNTMISFNMLEAARCKGVKRYFYSSSACVYNDDLQLDPENPGLKEGDAWPAKPQDTYGLEKLYAEEMGIVYGRDFGIKFRCARFHNVYGPRGTWKGGREKAPAAFCRKAVCATTEFEMWGDGKQTRSFMFIDDCVQGIQKIMDSDCEQPLNLGSDEYVAVWNYSRLAISAPRPWFRPKLGHDVPLIDSTGRERGNHRAHPSTPQIEEFVAAPRRANSNASPQRLSNNARAARAASSSRLLLPTACFSLMMSMNTCLFAFSLARFF